MNKIFGQVRKLFILVAIMALGLGYGAACLAEQHTSAQVAAHRIAHGHRIIFGWNSTEKVSFTIRTHGRQVIIHFAKPVQLEWGKSIENLYPYVEEVETQHNGATVILTLKQPSQTRYFRGYGKTGIDLMRTQNEVPMLVLDTPKSHHQTEAHERKLAAHSPIHHYTPAHSILPVPADTQAEARRLAVLSPSAGDAPSVSAPIAKVEEVTSTPSPSTLATQDNIELPIREGEAFAVLVQHKALWIVAGNSGGLLQSALQDVHSHFIKNIRALPASAQQTILYAPLTDDISAIVEKSSPGKIRLLLQKTPATAQTPLTPVVILNKAKQASIDIAAADAAHIISVHDPVSGNELNIVPLSTPGAGVAASRSFVEFTLLQSAQGIAIQKIADDITLSLHNGSLTIASKEGLTISNGVEEQLAADNGVPGATTLFPYARWKLDDNKNLVSMERKLLEDIAYSPPETANKARLKLLDIFLSQGLFTEAEGMANDILRSSYKFYVRNNVAALRGAAYFFMYRISDAERDFASPEFAHSAEAALWRNLCKELLGEETGTFNFLANYDRYIRNYPPVFIQKLALIAADRSINRKDYDAALNTFEALKKDNLDEPVKKYVDYMHAKILSETKGEEEAAKIWERQAADIDDPLIRSRAEFSLVNMLLRQNKITHEDAAKRLEKLRIVWRGDSLELNVLTLLGNLYVEDKQYAKALHAMRDVVLYYPEVPDAVTTAKQMEQTFVTLYNKGGADGMPPLDALSLFYEFRDLVPIGKDGDLMIRNLADRLVGIDLLDRAATLLDHQIRKRLQGDERSRVGARLALIYLLNHQPKEALETLKTTGYGDLPTDLQLTRLHLTAEALTQQGQVDKAIDVLSSDNSNDGTFLRLSIYWDNKDWPNVVTTAEEILGNRTDPSAPLSGPESDVLLKLATAYVYEHDTGQIQYLRDYFTPLLKNNPNKDSFLFITSESGTVDYQTLANLDADITTVKTFLDTYRDKVKKNGLSKAL